VGITHGQPQIHQAHHFAIADFTTQAAAQRLVWNLVEEAFGFIK